MACAIKRLEKMYRKDLLSNRTGVQNLKKEEDIVNEKLNKLLDAHLDNLISIDEYRQKKNELMEEKLVITQRISDFERKGNNWFGLAKEFLLELNSNKIKALKRKYGELSEFVKKMGSNFSLTNKYIDFKLQNKYGLALRAPLVPNCERF